MLKKAYKKELMNEFPKHEKNECGIDELSVVCTGLTGIKYVEFVYHVRIKGDYLELLNVTYGEASASIGTMKRPIVMEGAKRFFEEIGRKYEVGVYQEKTIVINSTVEICEKDTLFHLKYYKENMEGNVFVGTSYLEKEKEEKLELLLTTEEKEDKKAVYYSNEMKALLFTSEKMNIFYKEIKDNSLSLEECQEKLKEIDLFVQENIDKEYVDYLTTEEKFYIIYPYDLEREKQFNLFNLNQKTNKMEPYVYAKELKRKVVSDSLMNTMDKKIVVLEKAEKDLSEEEIKFFESVNENKVPLVFGNLVIHSEKMYKTKRNKLTNGKVVSFYEENTRKLGVIEKIFEDGKVFLYRLDEKVNRSEMIIREASELNTVEDEMQEEKTLKVAFLEHGFNGFFSAKMIAESEDSYIFKAHIGEEEIKKNLSGKGSGFADHKKDNGRTDRLKAFDYTLKNEMEERGELELLERYEELVAKKLYFLVEKEQTKDSYYSISIRNWLDTEESKIFEEVVASKENEDYLRVFFKMGDFYSNSNYLFLELMKLYMKMEGFEESTRKMLYLLDHERLDKDYEGGITTKEWEEKTYQELSHLVKKAKKLNI